MKISIFKYISVIIVLFICYSISMAFEMPGFKRYTLKYPLTDGSGTYLIACQWVDMPGQYKVYTISSTVFNEGGFAPLEDISISKSMHDRGTIEGTNTKISDVCLLHIKYELPDKEEYSKITMIADGKSTTLQSVASRFIEQGKYKAFSVSFTITPQVLNTMKRMKDLSFIFGNTTVKISPNRVIELRSFANDTENLNYIKCDEKVKVQTQK